MSKDQIIIDTAVEQLGSPYVYGTWGQLCTPALRKRYADYNPAQREITYARCQVLREKNPQPSCAGCQYNGKLAFDCRGFTHYCVLKAGIDIYGQKVSVQYDTAKNWDGRGDIGWMPDLVTCVFLDGHTGLYLKGGRVIHCSGEVKEEVLGEGRKWVHFAIPKGLYTMTELADALGKGAEVQLLRRGSQGRSVAWLQALLNAAGYDCGMIDAKYGAKTEEQVKALQEANGLKVDGIVGPATWALLIEPDQPELPEDDDELPEIPDDPQQPAEPDPEDPLITVRRSELLELRNLVTDAMSRVMAILGKNG